MFDGQANGLAENNAGKFIVINKIDQPQCATGWRSTLALGVESKKAALF
jgi:hypothetical protein